MDENKLTKRQKLAQKNAIKQAIKRLKRGVGAIQKHPHKGLGIVTYWAVLAGAYGARHEIFGYAPGDPLAPLNDLLAVLATGLPSVAGPIALTWAWGGPIGAGKVQDNLVRAGMVNAADEVPTLLSIERDPNNRNVKIYTFESCGISLQTWMDSADKLQTALNMTVVDIRYGIDHQHIQVSAVPPLTVWPTNLEWNDSLLSLEPTVLLIGLCAMGKVTIDLRIIPHILLGGSTGSGKTVSLKVLLRQCVLHNMDVHIADFKGGVDFGRWFRDCCEFAWDMDGAIKILDKLLAELERRKALFRDTYCSNIDQYNREYAPATAQLKRMVFACDELAFLLDKTGRSKERKAQIEQVVERLTSIVQQGRAFGIHFCGATQRPSADILPGQIRSCLDWKACARADSVLSDIIIDSPAAADLIPKDAQGRFILNSCGKLTVFQSYYLPDDMT